MSWREFSYLLSGLTGETPLGRIVSIRAEEDRETLRNFTKDEHRIRSEYRRKMAKEKSQKSVNEAIEGFKQAFIKMAGGADEEAEV